jgi:hypothetical protein
MMKHKHYFVGYLLMPVLMLCFMFQVLTASGVTDIPAFVGSWKGQFLDKRKDPNVVARIIGLGDHTYRIQLLPEFDKRAAFYIETEASYSDGKMTFDQGEWSGVVTDSMFTGTMNDKGKSYHFELRKIERRSTSIGRPAPKGAIVLFDGSDLDAWIHPNRPGASPIWKIEDEAMVLVPGKRVDGKRRKNDLVTKRSFTDIELHLEFKLPYNPGKRSQGRGNSGLFIQDFYEVQILDSYGLEGMWNECGALYKQAPPKVNMCAPPGQWQTYDIVYRSPRYNQAGNIISHAVITVAHNGKLIHNQVKLRHPTANSQKRRMTDAAPKEPAPIKLQDHNNIILFRNIWVREL